MRTVSGPMAAAIASGSTTLARIWRITKPDQTVIRLTDHTQDITVGAEVFLAAVGFTASATYISSLAGSAQSTQIVCTTSTLAVSDNDIRAGLLTGAPAKMSVVDYTNGSGGELVLMNGVIGRIQVSNRKRATVEILPRTAQKLQICSEQYSASCRNSLGDSLCTIHLDNFKTSFTVTAVATKQSITVSSLNSQVDGFYSLGHVIWRGGLNDGWISDVRVALANLSVQLFFPPPFAIAIGDAGDIFPGCDLQPSTCRLKFSNLVNFRGEPARPQWTVTASGAAPGGSGSGAASAPKTGIYIQGPGGGGGGGGGGGSFA